MLNFCDIIQVNVFTTNHHLNENLNNPKGPVFPKADYFSLNNPITHDEVRKSVYEAKLRKISGIDRIPTEALLNDICIDLLFKIIRHACTQERVPSNWSKGNIQSLPRGNDLIRWSDSLISVISIPYN